VDEIDQLEDRHAQEVEFARRDAEAREANKLAQAPKEFCEDCDDPLPALRQQMRCTRCVDCQDLAERRSRLLKRGL